MKMILTIAISLIYMLGCGIVLHSMGIPVYQIFTKADSEGLLISLIVVLPALASIVLTRFLRNKKAWLIPPFIISLLSLALLGINFWANNLKALNYKIEILSHWYNGMPKEIRYFGTSDKELMNYIAYFENGYIQKKVTFKNDKKTGNEFIFNQNSALKEINHYVNGELNFSTKFENHDEKIDSLYSRLSQEIDAKDVDELVAFIDEMSNLLSPCNSKNFTEIVYHLNGKIKTEQAYRNGKVNGRFIEYFDNGKIKTEGNLNGFDKIGEWKYFDSKGFLIKHELFDSTGILLENKPD